MGLKTFINNIRYLSKYNLKKMNKKIDDEKENILQTVNSMFDNYLFELPDHLNIIKKPKIKNYEETLDALINTDASFCRFGDGEYLLMENKSIPFQNASPLLAKRLKEIIQSENEKIMIGINYQYFYADLSNFLDYVKYVYRIYIPEIKETLKKYLIPGKQYYTSGITGVYMTFKEYNFVNYYKKMQQIWENKNITIICGERTFYNIDNNIFDNAKSIKFIFAPQQNAFEKYDEILNEALRCAPPPRLIITMLGPTAKILTYDLTQCGYRVLDMGHITKDYDAYIKKIPRDKDSIVKFFSPD